MQKKFLSSNFHTPCMSPTLAQPKRFKAAKVNNTMQLVKKNSMSKQVNKFYLFVFPTAELFCQLSTRCACQDFFLFKKLVQFSHLELAS